MRATTEALRPTFALYSPEERLLVTIADRLLVLFMELRDRWSFRSRLTRVRATVRYRTNMANITGGCLCGNVRYLIGSDPIHCGVCHCRDCQRFTGSAFVSAIRVPIDAVSVEGELRVIEVPGGSGQPIRRHFCPCCGSSVFGEPFRPGMINVMAGTLDDPSIFNPSTEVFCDSAHGWLDDGRSRDRYPRNRN